MYRIQTEKSCTLISCAFSLISLESGGGGKKGGKKKGSSFQTVSALFRVQTLFSLSRRKLSFILLCGQGGVILQGFYNWM